MTFRGEDIFRIKVPHSGVEIENPEYEWRSAAQWARYTFEGFQELDGERQARIVAHYRTHHQLEAVIAQAQVREMKIRARQRHGR